MAISYVNKTTNLSTSGSPVSFSFDVGSGGERLLVAIFSIRSTGAITGATYNGVALTQQVVQNHGDDGRVEIWYLANPASGNNTFQYTKANSADDVRCTLMAADGVDQTTPVNTSNSNGRTSGNGSTSLTTDEDGCLVVGGLSSEDGGTPGVGSGFTALYTQDEGTWSTGSEYQIQGSAGAITVNFTGQNDYNACAAVAFNPVLQAPPDVTPDTADNTETSDTTPELLFTGVDEGSLDIEYQVQVDTVDTFDSQSGNPLVAADSSVSDTGFLNKDNGGDTHPYTSGDQIGYTLQSALTRGTYYWRVRAKDPSGSNTWGDWTTTRKIRIYKTDHEFSRTLLDSIPTSNAHQYNSDTVVAVDQDYTDIETSNDTRITMTGGTTTMPYFLVKKQITNNPFNVLVEGQVNKESANNTVTYDNQTTGQGSSLPPGSTHTFNINVGSNSNRFLLLFIWNASPTGVTADGQNMTKYLDTNSVEVWYIVAPNTGNITIELLGTTSVAIWSCISVYNVDQSSPLAGYGDTNAVKAVNYNEMTYLSDSYTVQENGSMLLDFVYHSNSSISFGSFGDSQTQIGSNQSYTFTTAYASRKESVSAGSNSMGRNLSHSAGGTNITFYHKIIEIAPNSVSPSIKVDLWNFTTEAWVNQYEQTSPTQDTDFSQTIVKDSGYSDFIDGSGWVIARFYAEYTPDVALRVDRFVIELGAETKDVTVTAKSRIKATGISQTVSAKSRVLHRPSKPILVSPSDESSEQTPITFVWEIPDDAGGRPVHAQIQVDDTDNTFGSIEFDKKSWADSGFEYWNGSGWVSYPASGVTSAYYGNQARITLSLTAGLKYWRVRGGVG